MHHVAARDTGSGRAWWLGADEAGNSVSKETGWCDAPVEVHEDESSGKMTTWSTRASVAQPPPAATRGRGAAGLRAGEHGRLSSFLARSCADGVVCGRCSSQAFIQHEPTVLDG